MFKLIEEVDRQHLDRSSGGRLASGLDPPDRDRSAAQIAPATDLRRPASRARNRWQIGDARLGLACEQCRRRIKQSPIAGAMIAGSRKASHSDLKLMIASIPLRHSAPRSSVSAPLAIRAGSLRPARSQRQTSSAPLRH